MGLFQLFNSVWLIHCLKSQIAMMKLIGKYFGFDGVSFQIIVFNSYIAFIFKNYRSEGYHVCHRCLNMPNRSRIKDKHRGYD